MSKALLGAGVTSFLPTALTASFEILDDICRTAADFAGKESGARIQDFSLKDLILQKNTKGLKTRLI